MQLRSLASLMVASTMLLAACAQVDWLVGSSPSAIASRNQKRLELLEPGMTEAQVREIMGEFGSSLSHGIKNPYRVERAAAVDLKVTVVYYYTHSNSDRVVTDDELTPVVLIDDEMVGYGRAALAALAHQR